MSPRRGRQDSVGKKRLSLYVREEAADAIERATDEVLASLGEDVPRHVAVSELLLTAAEHTEEVKRKLSQQRAEQLTAQLAHLQKNAQDDSDSA